MEAAGSEASQAAGMLAGSQAEANAASNELRKAKLADELLKASKRFKRSKQLAALS